VAITKSYSNTSDREYHVVIHRYNSTRDKDMSSIYQTEGYRERGTKLKQYFKQFIGGGLDQRNGRLHPSYASCGKRCLQ